MTNTPHANNLISKQKFQDYKIHAEYKLEQNSNSGIYHPRTLRAAGAR